MLAEETKTRQSKLGELCWVATFSRPEICARSAKIASCADSLRGSDGADGNGVAEGGGVAVCNILSPMAESGFCAQGRQRHAQ